MSMTTFTALRVFRAYLGAIGLASLALRWVTPQLPVFTDHLACVYTILGYEFVRLLVGQRFIGLTESKPSYSELTHQKM